MKKIQLSLFFTLFYINSNFAQWSNVNIGTSQDLYSVDYYSTNDIWIGSFQQIIKSSSGGVSWSIINPIKDNVGVDITPANMYDLALTSPTNAIGTGLFFMGNTECILNTTNGGINWDFASTNSTVGLPRYLNAVDVSGTRSVAVGNNGRIAKSTNSGVSWTFVSSGVSSLISDVKFSTFDTLFAAGDNKIFRSVDGGSTWTNQTISGSFKSISCDRGVVYAGGPGIIYKSVDYGVTYTPIITPFSYQGTLYAIDKDTVLAAGDDGIYVSRTGGAYWEKYVLPSYQQVNMFDFLNQNTGIAVGNLGYSVRTNNLSLAPKIAVSAFSIIGGLTTYCEGDSITFSNTSLTGCNYLWQINGSTFSSNYSTALILNNEGQQTISLIVSNANGSDTSSITINVIGHHINSIPALVAEDSVCSGNIIGFSIQNSQIGVNYQLRQGYINIGAAQAGNGGVLYFSSLNPITATTTYSIKALKTTA
ncbi:MAG: hypothetical protein L6Q66_03635, partial [Bacteroidia bacterium]|nr:hypothetical protein [Bacteroidia bacterium]